VNLHAVGAAPPVRCHRIDDATIRVTPAILPAIAAVATVLRVVPNGVSTLGYGRNARYKLLVGQVCRSVRVHSMATKTGSLFRLSD
jgi:hypothetical protein